MKRRILLTVSLLLNLLFAGGLAGYFLRPTLSGWDAVVGKAIKPLPPERQQIITVAFENIHQSIQNLYQESCTARDDAAKLLSAQPFDKSAYLAKIERVQEIRRQMGMKIGDELGDLTARLTPPERDLLADATRRMTMRDYVFNSADDKKKSCEIKTPASN